MVLQNVLDPHAKFLTGIPCRRVNLGRSSRFEVYGIKADKRIVGVDCFSRRESSTQSRGRGCRVDVGYVREYALMLD